MKPSVKVIILNWNQAQITIDCIKSVEKISYENFSILVIDNGSDDNSIELLHNEFPNIEILSLDKNYKYAGAYNLAFNHINKEKIDYLMLLNNDTIVHSDIVTNFIKNINPSTNFIFGPKIYYYKDKNKIWYAGGIVDLRNGKLYHRGIREIDYNQYNTNFDIDYVSGCCMFAPKEVFLLLKGFDTNFNMYGEDVDFCIRANNNNIKCTYIYDSLAWHHVSASINKKKKVFVKILSIWKLMHKHLSFINKFRGFIFYIVRNLYK